MTGDRCPDIERWAELADGRLSDESRLALEEHARVCPLCRTELELAREFAQPAQASHPAKPMQEASDVAYVVSALERRFGSAGGESVADRVRGKVVAFPSSRTWTRRYAPLAAAAVLVLALGYWGRSGTPGLPDPQNGAVLRAGLLEIEGPMGDLAGGPQDGELSFTWRRAAEAAVYRVTLVDVTDRVLWTQETPAGAATGGGGSTVTIQLPSAARGGLTDRTRYRWRVEALGPDGAAIGESPWTYFRWKGRP